MIKTTRDAFLQIHDIESQSDAANYLMNILPAIRANRFASYPEGQYAFVLGILAEFDRYCERHLIAPDSRMQYYRTLTELHLDGLQALPQTA